MAKPLALPTTRLTEKKTKFVKAIAKQVREGKPINLTEAALQAYDSKDRVGARSIGSETMAKPDVREAVAMVLRRKGITLSKISGNIGKLADKEPEKVTANVILRSNVELLKLLGAYPTQKSAHVSLSVRASLKDMKYQEVQHELKRIDGELQDVMEGKVIE